MRRHPLSQAYSVATFEMALDEICSRQDRCYHALQLLLAAFFVLFVLSLCYVAICVGRVYILWGSDEDEQPAVGGVWLLCGSGACMLFIRLIERVLSVETSTETARRANRTFAAAGLSVAFDHHSRCLYSNSARLIEACARGEEPNASPVTYRSTTDH
jgi:hypothetical protein